MTDTTMTEARIRDRILEVCRKYNVRDLRDAALDAAKDG